MYVRLIITVVILSPTVLTFPIDTFLVSPKTLIRTKHFDNATNINSTSDASSSAETGKVEMAKQGDETSQGDKRDYVESTRQNYEGRVNAFSAWAEDGVNSVPAERCRRLLSHFLSNSLGNSNAGAFDILDAGCGDGRDVSAFGRCQLAVPHESLDQPVCRSANVPITSSPYPLGAGASKKFVPVNAYGFDVAQGFVDQCRQKGLDVVRSDFQEFFDKDQYSGTKKLPQMYHGIFTLASLFHLPKSDLKRTLSVFRQHMYPGGMLLTTIPDGTLDEKIGDGRWILKMPLEEQMQLLRETGFKPIYNENVSIYNNNQWKAIVSQV